MAKSTKIKGTAVQYVGGEDYRTINEVTWSTDQVIILDDEVAAYLFEVAGSDFVQASDEVASESLQVLAEAADQGELDFDVDASVEGADSDTDA